MQNTNRRTWMLVSAMLLATLNSGFADSVVWDGGGDGLNWEDPLNWDGDALPGPGDEASIGNTFGSMNLSSDQSVQQFYTDAETFNHSAGRLSGTVLVDNHLFAGRTSTYAMSGTAHIDGVFFASTGFGSAALTMRDSSQLTSPGFLAMGGDAAFEGSLFDDASVTAAGQFRFASFGNPTTLTFHDRSSLLIGSLRTDAAIEPSTLSFVGSSVSITVGEMLIDDEVIISFTADVGGISTVDVNGAFNLVDTNTGIDPQLTIDLSAYSAADALTLFDGSELASGQFRDLPEGAIVPGSGGRAITYSGGDGFDIMLVPVPEPSVPLLASSALLGVLFRRRRS